MKRIIKFLFVAVSLVALASSCKKDDYGTYDFFTNTVISVTDQGRAAIIGNTIGADSYFSKIHSYTGTLSSAVNQAANDFETHLDLLDIDKIKSNLVFGETVKISLWSMDPGQSWLTYVITSNALTFEKE